MEDVEVALEPEPVPDAAATPVPDAATGAVPLMDGYGAAEAVDIAVTGLAEVRTAALLAATGATAEL